MTNSLNPKTDGTLPKFSVITVSFNQGEFIRDTIESVLSQNYPNFEHIVIDAGSTDNTIEILQSYPHLKWTSEPDRGQSHGLNKGFARATGDVVAWLNSDDWYAPNTFYEVASRIETSPVVMGKCYVADRAGTPGEEIQNTERSWFDTIKYWVFHSIPTQPGIFFRREIFSELKINPLFALDESLNFTMDFDLWLRIQERFPFNCRVDKTFAYARVYETNKTGADMAGAYREMSRVYRRHSVRRCNAEQLFSVCILVDSVELNLDQILDQISKQTIKQVELLLVFRSKVNGIAQRYKSKLEELAKQYPTVACRYVSTNRLPNTNGSLAQDVKSAADLCASQYVFLINAESGEVKWNLTPDFVARCLERFAQDNLGLLHVALSNQDKDCLFDCSRGWPAFNAVGAFSANPELSAIVIRKLALLDVFSSSEGALLRSGAQDDRANEHVKLQQDQLAQGFSLKWLQLQLTHRAWQISLIDTAAQVHNPTTSSDVFRLYENCRLVDELSTDLRRDPFALVRARNGFALVIPDELWDVARQTLASAPSDWALVTNSSSELSDITSRYPDFGPAHYHLAQQLRASGNSEAAAREYAVWQEIHKKEQQSPLFGRTVVDSEIDRGGTR